MGNGVRRQTAALALGMAGNRSASHIVRRWSSGIVRRIGAGGWIPDVIADRPTNRDLRDVAVSCESGNHAFDAVFAVASVTAFSDQLKSPGQTLMFTLLATAARGANMAKKCLR